MAELSIEIVPVTITDAQKYVSQHHRHHRAPLTPVQNYTVLHGEQLVRWDISD
jgi:hypothetical protein